MHPIFINGIDVCIDADFFVGLGADRDTIEVVRDPIAEGYEYKFIIDDQVFVASWFENDNALHINCAGIKYADWEIADKKLLHLSDIMTQDMFGGLIVRKIVARAEGCMPELLILFYED